MAFNQLNWRALHFQLDVKWVQMGWHSYLSPIHSPPTHSPLTQSKWGIRGMSPRAGSVRGKCCDTYEGAVMAWQACSTTFNERQLRRASDSVVTGQGSTPRSGLLRRMMKTNAVAWWTGGGGLFGSLSASLHQYQITLCTSGLIAY